MFNICENHIVDVVLVNKNILGAVTEVWAKNMSQAAFDNDVFCTASKNWQEQNGLSLF